MAQVYQRSIIQMGQSTGVTLPKSWLDYYNVRVGDKIELVTVGRKAVLRIVPTELNADFDESDIKDR